jgi:ABC-type lipoprotein release transport system permease subunit
MSLFLLIMKEILYRKVNTLIIFLTVVIAASVTIAVYTLSKASEDETRKIMREQGLNLYIFPSGTDLVDLFSAANSKTFPEKYVDDLANSKTFDAVRHLTGILQVRFPDWKDPNGSSHTIILSGYKDEAMQRYLAPQEIMHFDVEKGTAQLGALVARNIPEGTPFEIMGNDGKLHSLKVVKRFEEGRGLLDQGVSLNLGDLQEITGLSGQINRIEAIGCVCADGRIKNARKQVQSLFPDLEVTELSSIADARENQRMMMNRYGAFIISFVVITCFIITALLFYQNNNSRKREFALLRAMGKSPATIIIMILSKAFLIGLAGGFAGFFAGTFIAGYFGRAIFSYTAMNIHPYWNLLWLSMIVFPLLWMISSWIPALIASKSDAARILSEE